jgi:hypothetical protein
MVDNVQGDHVERSAFEQFIAAVDAFSQDPAANLERYLVASRALEESRRNPPRPAFVAEAEAPSGRRGRRTVGAATTANPS